MISLRKYLPQGLGRQISLVVAGDAITTSSVLMSGMILARILSRNDMGTYRQVLYLVLLSASIADMGLSTTVYRFWTSLDPRKRATYLRMLLVISFLLCTIAGAGLALLSHPLSQWYHNPDLATLLLVAAPVPLASVPLQFIRPALISEGHSIRATALQTIFEVVPIIAIVVPAWAGLDLHLSIISWAGVSMLRLVAVPMVMHRYVFMRGAPWWERQLIRDVWSYVWPIQLSRGPGLVIAYLDKVIMSVFLSPQGFAIYSLGAREIPFVTAIGSSVSSVLIPHLSRDWDQGNVDQICRRWKLACIRTALLTYPIAAFCAYHASPLVVFLFSAAYEESSVPFRIFCLITFIRVIEYASLAKAINQTRTIMFSSAVSAAAFVTLAFLLTCLFGMAGMACAILAAFFVGAAYLLFSYRSSLSRSLLCFFPLYHLVLLVALAFSAVVAGDFLLARWIPLEQESTMFSLAWMLGVHFVICAAVFILLLLVLGRVLPSLRVFQRTDERLAS